MPERHTFRTGLLKAVVYDEDCKIYNLYNGFLYFPKYNPLLQKHEKKFNTHNVNEINIFFMVQSQKS